MARKGIRDREENQLFIGNKLLVIGGLLCGCFIDKRPPLNNRICSLNLT